MTNTTVISAFPGTGKSHLFRKAEGHRTWVMDSDSSLFSWLSPGVRNPEFPQNYIQHIQEHIGRADWILVSSHREVRDALKAAGIQYVSVYPSVSCKAEYLQRFVDRGSPEQFIHLLTNNWGLWLNDMFSDTWGPEHEHMVLNQGQYLSDVVYLKN